jgi:hypothetical protein
MARSQQYYLHPQYDPLIIAAAKQNDINPNLLRGIFWQESHFDPRLTGPMNRPPMGPARGIAQLTADTQQELGVKDPYDPAEAIPAAARLLAGDRQVAVARGYQNPDAYAAMAYYGGHNFKGPDVRPPAGVPGPSIGEYAQEVFGHARSFHALANDQPLPTVTPAQLSTMTGPPLRVAGPNVGGATWLQPTSGPLPTNWADVPGAPPSMREAPPSMYTASSPAAQARWNAVSTPQGYEAAIRSLAGSGSPSPAAGVQESPGFSVPTVLPPRVQPDLTGVQEDPARSVPTVLPPRVQPDLTAGPGSVMPPPATGPAAASPSAPLVTSPTQPVYNPATGAFEQRPRPPAPGGPDSLTPPAQPAMGPAAAAPGDARTLTNEQVAKMGPEDVFGIVTQGNLTDADRAALQTRLLELQQQQQQQRGGGGV